MIITELYVPMDGEFIKKCRSILGTSKINIPMIRRVDSINGVASTLGVCRWNIGEPEVEIDIVRNVNSPKTLKRILAHELVHEAEFLLFWHEVYWDTYNSEDFPADDKAMEHLVRTIINEHNKDEHGKYWLKYAAKINAVFGKNFVTPYSDELYGLDKQ